MKLKNIILTVSFIGLMVFNTTLFAQDSSYNLIKKELTQKQMDLLQKEREVIKTNRDAFKASLTQEQLAILKDKTISKNEIRKRLVATFSSNQKSMVQNQQVRLRKTRESFRKTLTGEQRKMLKERIDKIRNSKVFMGKLDQRIKKICKVFGLLLFSVATSFCSYAQDKTKDNLDDIDSLIDELFFDDQQFLDELMESNFSYNFLYTSFSYNNNTFFSGRDSGTDQFNIIPQISYYHSSGFNASISGIYYQEFDPAWDFTSVSLGYFNTFGKTNTFVYNIGYTKFFYGDDFDDFTNSIDMNIGMRNKKRTLGTTIAASYLFGSDETYQIVSNSFANITLKRTPKMALRLRPNINFIIANQTITFIRPFEFLHKMFLIY